MAELVVAGRIANPRRRVAGRVALAPKSRFAIHHGATLATTAHAGGPAGRKPTPDGENRGPGRADRNAPSRPRPSLWTRLIARLFGAEPVDPATVIATDPIIGRYLDQYNTIRERRGMDALTAADLEQIAAELIGRKR